jgi:hypothetical protein
MVQQGDCLPCCDRLLLYPGMESPEAPRQIQAPTLRTGVDEWLRPPSALLPHSRVGGVPNVVAPPAHQSSKPRPISDRDIWCV